ncbi:MAG: SAM-dependent methyltransferase [Brevirhabdus sp.]
MWEDRYKGEDYLFGRAPARFLTEQADLLRGDGRALAVADGEGRNSVFLAKHGLDVTAFDYAPSAVAKARKLARDAGVEVEFQLSDIESWTWAPEAFEMVAGIFIQFVMPSDRPQLFANLDRTLRPGGQMVLHGYTPKQVEFGTGGPPRADMMYTADMLRDAFAGYEITRLEEYEAEVREGRGHVGRSALIDFIATKPM